MSYFFVDVEADGPCPGLYSMVSFGAVKFDDDLKTTFYGRTRPITNNYKLEALQISCPDRETHLSYDNPVEVMKDFTEKIKEMGPNPLKDYDLKPWLGSLLPPASEEESERRFLSAESSAAR